VRDVASSFDCRLLLVRHKAGTIWSWFGVRRALDPGEIADHVSSRWDPISLALGEPGRGLSGWRLTHRQASAALPIALRGNRRLVRYSDVALLASTLKDETLMSSLRDLYLTPLSEERDGGAARRATLRAYFDAERNASSAAAAIGVSRQTVVSRLQALEERFGRPIGRWAVEMDVALRLDALTNPTPSRQADPP
jgi:DNA-binding PucR family transcriptional regulator